jgi:hypothetical protein
MKCESLITYHSKDMANIKVFEKWVKLQGQGHKIKNNGTDRMVVSYGKYTRNMIALSLTIQKIWPMLKFLKSG